MEEVLFLWRWGVHRGWVGPPALPLHLGKKRWKPGQDPPRNKGGAAAGCCGKIPMICASVSCYRHVHLNRIRKLHLVNNFLFVVASSSTNYSIHFKWFGVHMGTESSGKYLSMS